MFFGSAIGIIGVFSSTFSKNFWEFYFSYSVLYGISVGILVRLESLTWKLVDITIKTVMGMLS
jgi:hypothetical protein